MVNISDTLFGLPIVSVEDETVDEDVYDLSVADMESFVTGFGGVLWRIIPTQIATDCIS